MKIQWDVAIVLIIAIICLWEGVKLLSIVLYYNIRIWYINLQLEILEKDNKKQHETNN